MIQDKNHDSCACEAYSYDKQRINEDMSPATKRIEDELGPNCEHALMKICHLPLKE